MNRRDDAEQSDSMVIARTVDHLVVAVALVLCSALAGSLLSLFTTG